MIFGSGPQPTDKTIQISFFDQAPSELKPMTSNSACLLLISISKNERSRTQKMSGKKFGNRRWDHIVDYVIFSGQMFLSAKLQMIPVGLTTPSRSVTKFGCCKQILICSKQTAAAAAA